MEEVKKMEGVVWENGVEVYRIWVGEEVVKECINEIKAEDVLEVKAQRGFNTIVVLDKETNKALTKADFPHKGDIVILPVYKAGSF